MSEVGRLAKSANVRFSSARRAETGREHPADGVPSLSTTGRAANPSLDHDHRNQVAGVRHDRLPARAISVPAQSINQAPFARAKTWFIDQLLNQLVQSGVIRREYQAKQMRGVNAQRRRHRLDLGQCPSRCPLSTPCLQVRSSLPPLCQVKKSGQASRKCGCLAGEDSPRVRFDYRQREP